MNYNKYVTDSLYSAMYKILKDIEYKNAKGYKLYISFFVKYPGVMLQNNLEYYENEEILTIVLENQFWNLSADYFGFKVTVLLNNEYCETYIPYKAITIFSDPKKDFLLDFQRHGLSHSDIQEGESLLHSNNERENENIIEVDFTD